MNTTTSCLRTLGAKSSYILSLLLAGLAANLTPQLGAAGCEPAPAGLVGWWPGDGSARDLAGTNNGSLQGGATATASGLVGSAFSFDGTNGFVQVPNAPALRPTNLTIGAWVNFSGLDSARSGGAPAGNQFLVFKQNSKSGNFEGYSLEKFRLARGDAFSFMVASPAGQEVVVYSSTTISTGLWYYVAAIRGTNSLQLYVNGVLEAQTNVTFPQDYGTQAVYFGSSGASFWDGKLKGRLDEVSLYNRALSAAEIAAIYAAGASGKCKDVNITAQPQNQTVQLGGPANFSVSATGFGTLSYQWRFSGASLPGATSTSLTLSNVQSSNVGNYDVVVTNSFSAATSSVAVLALLSPPSITSQPQSQTIHAGVAATFSVTASGVPAPSFQWYFNGTMITDQTRSSGSSTATLTLSNAQFAEAGAYYVIATNSSGSATSALATLTVTGFHPINAGLMPLSLGSGAWGDFNNDGRLDILMTGNDSNGVPRIVLYRNDGNGVFTDTAANLPGLFVSGVAWGDYDNDGYLDFAANGLTSDSSGLGLILHNQRNGTFTNVATLFNWAYGGIANTREGAVAWADYDNDGCLDPLFMGVGYNLMHYNPKTSQFEDRSIVFPFCHYAACAWGDYDKDGYPDIFAAGQPDSAPLGLFRNTGAGAFTLTNLPLPILVGGSSAWGDFDNDGNLDIAIGGWAYLGPLLTGVYRNLGGTNFIPVITNLPAALMGSVAWGDYDNDGYLDLLIAVPDVTRLYHNNGDGTFTDTGDVLPGCEDGVAVWGDYDNDGRLDILIMGGGLGGGMAQVFHNDYLRANTPPSAPASLSSRVLGNAATLSWSAATDAEQAGGLSYNVRIGSAPGGSDILGPMAELATGWRRLPALGNAGLRLSRLITNLDAGTYYWSVQAIDHAYAGSTFASEQSFTVGPPVITRQPVTQAVPLGQWVGFSVAVTDPGPMTYQWYFNGWPLVDNGHLVGATSTSLTLSNALASDAGSYKVVVSNSAFAVTSAVAVLSVWMPPGIIVQPQDASVVLGGTAFFSTIVTGAPPPLFQWYFGNSPLTNSVPVSGATTNSLSLHGVQSGDAGGYWLRVVNRGGAVTSRVAQLTILFPPAITNQPQSQTVVAGTPVSFSVQASGTAPLMYQWLFNSARIAGATTMTLFLPSAQASNQGNYSVVVSNNYGIATSQLASLTVLSPPWITQQPQDQGAVPGSNAVFTVVAQGATPLLYQWQKDGQNLTDDAHLTGANASTLSITDAQTNDSGTYYLVVTNAYGAVTSALAMLTVVVPPAILNPPASQTVLTGTNAVLSVLASGSEPLSCHWFFNGATLTDNAHLSGSVSPSLTISNVVLADAGNYTVTVSNLVGVATSAPAALTVWQLPYFTTQTIGRSVALGFPATLTAAGSGTPAPTYQWQLNGADIPGATNSSLSLASVGVADAGTYTVTLSNAAGVAVSAPALLSLGPVATWARSDSGQALIPPALSNVVMISSGSGHCLALSADGTVIAWGDNTYGQTNVPAGLSNIVAVAAGGSHSLALRSDGLVFAWGNNNYGQATVPTTLSNVVAIAGGAYHSLAVRADGALVTWGNTSSGLAMLPTGLHKVVGAAGGSYHTLARLSDGTEVAWGNIYYLQTIVPPTLSNVVDTAAGAYHSVACQANGSVASWGMNVYGQVTNQPVSLTNSVTVAAGDYHSLALRSDGTVAAWGRNNYGQTNLPAALSNVVAIAAGGSQNMALLGDGRPLLTRQPVGGTFCTGRALTLQAAAAGVAPLAFQWQHNGLDIPDATNATLSLLALLVTDAGTYQVTVSNALGVAISLPAPLNVQDGVVPFFLTTLPLVQTNNLGARVALWSSVGGSGPLSYQWRLNGQDIPGATNEELVFDPITLTNTGLYAVFVTNAYGALLSPSDTLRVRQIEVWGIYAAQPSPAASNVVAIASSSGPYLVLRNDGTVASWSGPAGSLSTPAWVSNIVAIAAGSAHGLGLRADGTVLAWGSNSYGQTNVPPTLNNAIAVAAGNSHSLALRADGTVLVWGSNSYGQTNVPTAATGVVAIASGYNHNLAVRADGTVVGWGYNSYGQATPPKGLGNIIAVATGYEHSLALKSDGTVAAWGYGYYGATNVPAGLTNVVAIAAGVDHSLALKSDGTAVDWGTYDQTPAYVPSDIANAIQLAGVYDSDLALFGTRAPHITIQPFNRTLFRGSNTTMIAKAVGAQPMAYQWQFNGSDLPGATTDSLTLSNLQFSDAGAYRLVVTNSYGLVASSSAKLLVQVPLSEALDATNLIWTSSGNAPWFGQADTTVDGKSAARSGAIGNSQQSVLATTAFGPGQLSFWWKVSSEQFFDTMDFRIGSTTQAVISGEVGWEQRTFTIPSGSQSLTWRYLKDPTSSGGQDAGWVDQVLFVPDPPVIAYPPFGATANMGATVYLSARATGSPPLSYQWFKDGNALQGATGSMLTLSTVTRRDSGLYFVQVSNPGGSTPSTNALVKVLVPQKLGTPAAQPDGSLLLTSGDADGHPLLPSDLPNFEAQFSADLVNWSPLPGALSLTNGLLQLQDTDRASAPVRFYRIIEH